MTDAEVTVVMELTEDGAATGGFRERGMADKTTSVTKHLLLVLRQEINDLRLQTTTFSPFQPEGPQR